LGVGQHEHARLDVANGDASTDTIRGYRSQLVAWVNWCGDNDVDARLATVEDLKRYREDLVAHGDSLALLVHGKYHDRLVFLRPDVADAVRAYLASRGTITPDELGEALIVADGISPAATG
jgi:hypothetical protein